MSGCHTEFAAADPVELFAVNYLSVIVHLVSWVASKTISVQINYVVYNLGLNWGQESGFITERFERRVQRMSVGREKDPQTSLFIDIVFKTRSRSYKFGRTVNIFSDLMQGQSMKHLMIDFISSITYLQIKNSGSLQKSIRNGDVISDSRIRDEAEIKHDLHPNACIRLCLCLHFTPRESWIQTPVLPLHNLLYFTYANLHAQKLWKTVIPGTSNLVK